MNIEEIQKHYWTDIIAMSKHYNIKPWKLVKVMDNYDEVFLNNHPNFLAYDLDMVKITFAETVIEGKPIFKWDKVYSSLDGDLYTVLDKIDYLGETIVIDDSGEECEVDRTRLLIESPRIVLQLHKRDIEVILSVLNNFDKSLIIDSFVKEIQKVQKTLKEFIE